MDMNLTPNAASPELVQDTTKVMTMTDEQRMLACDLGYYNEVIQGYLILSMQNAGFSREDIDKALGGLFWAWDDNSAAEAREAYRKYGE